MSVAQRYQDVAAQVARAACAAGRNPSEVTLVGVSKRQPIESLFEAYDAGLRDFGENHVQDLVAKAAAMDWTGRTPRWHFIGPLQRNKINALLPTGALIHSVDGLELAQAIDKRAAVPASVLLQVNIGREGQKSGCDPEQAVSLAAQIGRLPQVRLRGLMAIPPLAGDPVVHFRHLADLRDAIVKTAGCEQATELSMGMSQDFLQAIASGATIVRVGTAIFGERL